MPDERVAESPAFNPALSRQHLLILLPLFGMLIVWRARAAAADEADRAELSAALRCQIGGALIWGVHLVLQAAILGVWWLVVGTPGGSGLVGVTKVVVVVGSALNLLMLLLEWGVLVLAGIRASRGRPYPLSRRHRRQAAAEARAERRHWKPLNDE